MHFQTVKFNRKPSPALRLSISRLKTGWAVIGEQKIPKMTLPAHHQPPNLPDKMGLGGTWFEVRDQREKLLYLRRFTMPTPRETHGIGGELGRDEIPPEVAAPIQIIVPDLPTGATLRLYSVAHAGRGDNARRRHTPPVPFAVFKRT